MVRKINALKVRQNLGQLLDEVYHTGDQSVIERAGKARIGSAGEYIRTHRFVTDRNVCPTEDQFCPHIMCSRDSWQTQKRRNSINSRAF